MAATIRKRTTKQLDKFGNPVVSYQVRWLEPIRDEFGAPTGKFKQTSETFPPSAKPKRIFGRWRTSWRIPEASILHSRRRKPIGR